MVQALCALMDFIYIAQCNIIDSDDALKRFHNYWRIFQDCGIWPTGFNLPRQHSLIHYHALIWSFSAPNRLCSSITESKHIKAVKEPWRRSSHFQALGQMLLINQRLDNLAASHIDFANCGMLKGTCLSYVLDQLGNLSFNYFFLDVLICLKLYRAQQASPSCPGWACCNSPTWHTQWWQGWWRWCCFWTQSSGAYCTNMGKTISKLLL